MMKIEFGVNSAIKTPEINALFMFDIAASSTPSMSSSTFKERERVSREPPPPHHQFGVVYVKTNGERGRLDFGGQLRLFHLGFDRDLSGLSLSTVFLIKKGTQPNHGTMPPMDITGEGSSPTTPAVQYFQWRS